MRNKRSMPTIVEQAILSVDGFEKKYKTFGQQVILKAKARVHCTTTFVELF